MRDPFEFALDFVQGIFYPPTSILPPAPDPVPVIVTLEVLRGACPRLKDADAIRFIPPLQNALREFEINSLPRVAAFLAQVGEESVDLTHWEENLNYSPEGLMRAWPKRFPDRATADRYAHHPEKIANYVYANRMGNGDESSGDGWKNRGRGPIQLTGADNYWEFGSDLDVDLVNHPELVLDPQIGFRVAALFWKRKGLNELADRRDDRGMTLRINGGLLGLDERTRKRKANELLLAA